MSAPKQLIESKYASGAAVIGLLLAVLLTHGNLWADFGVLALISGLGRANRLNFPKRRNTNDD